MATYPSQAEFHVLLCDCEGTSALDPSAIEQATGRKPDFCGTQLCRRQLPEVQSRLASGEPVLIGNGDLFHVDTDGAGEISIELVGALNRAADGYELGSWSITGDSSKTLAHTGPSGIYVPVIRAEPEREWTLEIR